MLSIQFANLNQMSIWILYNCRNSHLCGHCMQHFTHSCSKATPSRTSCMISHVGEERRHGTGRPLTYDSVHNSLRPWPISQTDYELIIKILLKSKLHSRRNYQSNQATISLSSWHFSFCGIYNTGGGGGGDKYILFSSRSSLNSILLKKVQSGIFTLLWVTKK